jgi:hypothetical protein
MAGRRTRSGTGPGREPRSAGQRAVRCHGAVRWRRAVWPGAVRSGPAEHGVMAGRRTRSGTRLVGKPRTVRTRTVRTRTVRPGQPHPRLRAGRRACGGSIVGRGASPTGSGTVRSAGQEHRIMAGRGADARIGTVRPGPAEHGVVAGRRAGCRPELGSCRAIPLCWAGTAGAGTAGAGTAGAGTARAVAAGPVPGPAASRHRSARRPALR